jgi:hypothetical protein
MAKIALLVSALLLLLAPLLAHADTIQLNTDVNDGSSFNVSEILSTGSGDEEADCTSPTLTGDEQAQCYFQQDNPILAFILQVINFLTQVIGTLAMVLIIAGGVLMIISEGDENRLQKGKGILETAIVGLIIAMFSYIIVRFVQSLFYLQ